MKPAELFVPFLKIKNTKREESKINVTVARKINSKFVNIGTKNKNQLARYLIIFFRFVIFFHTFDDSP